MQGMKLPFKMLTTADGFYEIIVETVSLFLLFYYLKARTCRRNFYVL